MVDVTTDEPVNFKPHGFFVGGDGGGDDTRVGVVDFRAAVLGLEDIGPRLHAVAFRIFRAGGVDRFGEIQCEAVMVCISKGVLPVHLTRSKVNGLLPRDAQPRLDPPAKMIPASPS